MSYQPGEQPYTQPQDPWSGTQGIASAPTDPIPQPPRGQYTPGVASPSVWVQETVAHSDPYVAQGRGGGRGGLYTLVVLLVVVLGGAGGFGAWWAITNYSGLTDTPSNTTTTTGATTGPTSPTPQPTEVRYRGEVIPVGTCMINRGTPENAEMFIVACDWPGDLEKLEVLKTYSGETIPEDAAGDFTADITAQPLCSDLPRFNRYFGWNSSNDAQDSFYCMTTDVDA
jgi:hypothetical protein